MRLTGVRIGNLLSYMDASFELKGYNVIVGPNNAGKTNLLRILHMARDKLGGFSLRRDYRHDRNSPSRLALGMSFTDREFRAVLQSVLLMDVKRAEFPAECRELQVLIGWDKPLGSETTPTNTQVHFRRGISAVFDHDSIALFDTGRASEGGPDEIFHKSGNYGMDKVMEHLEGKGMSRMKSIPDGVDLGDAFSMGAGSGDVFTADGRPAYYTAEKTTSSHDEIERVIAEINEVVGDKWNHDPRRALGSVLHAMLMKSTVSVEERYPSLEALTDALFDLKSHDDDAYDMIRKGFSGIFDKTDVQVELAVGSNQRAISIKDGGAKYPIKEAASGHYAALHILHTITGRSDGMILLDEPETHFHPSKIRQMGKALREISASRGNQVVLLTHSPEFVDAGMLDPGSQRRLIRVARDGRASVASHVRHDQGTRLGPHLLDPRVFFGAGSLIVEGPSDEYSMKAISDAYGGVLDQLSVSIVSCTGIRSVEPYAGIHRSLGIPYAAMVDSDYRGDDPHAVKLEADLEHEMRKTGWSGEGKKIGASEAYQHVSGLMGTGEGREMMRRTGVWKAFCRALEIGGMEPAGLAGAGQ